MLIYTHTHNISLSWISLKQELPGRLYSNCYETHPLRSLLHALFFLFCFKQMEDNDGFQFYLTLMQCSGVLESSWTGVRRGGFNSYPVHSSCLIYIKSHDFSEPQDPYPSDKGVALQHSLNFPEDKIELRCSCLLNSQLPRPSPEILIQWVLDGATDFFLLLKISQVMLIFREVWGTRCIVPST